MGVSTVKSLLIAKKAFKPASDDQYCSPAWSPYYKTDERLLERIQHHFMQMIPDLEDLRYEERLKELVIW